MPQEGSYTMKMTRTELMPGVWLNHLESDKFKTACMSISLLTQLQRDTAAMNALIPFVLRRGTAHYGDMEQLSLRLDDLYGAAIDPLVRRIGEIQTVGLVASWPESAYLPGGVSVTRDTVALLGEMLLQPATRGGLLQPGYVESEKEKLADIIRSRINEKTAYSVTRCIEEMCCYEDFAVGRFGSAEDCDNIHYKKLTRRYQSLLQSSPIEIFYCGQDSRKLIASAVKDALCTLPRGELDYEIGTDVRMNAVEDSVRYYEEELDVVQGKLVLGFRLGECMEEPDKAALSVFNTVYGAGVTSKLFCNVREKLQLCYYASSILDAHKGLMIVASGIDFSRYEEAKAEILRQLEEIRAGNISDEELACAKAGVISDLAAMLDSPSTLESFYIGNILDGLEITPEEYSDLVSRVSRETVAAIAAGIELDLVYFLKGEAAEAAEEKVEEAE